MQIIAHLECLVSKKPSLLKFLLSNITERNINIIEFTQHQLLILVFKPTNRRKKESIIRLPCSHQQTTKKLSECTHKKTEEQQHIITNGSSQAPHHRAPRVASPGQMFPQARSPAPFKSNSCSAAQQADLASAPSSVLWRSQLVDSPSGS